MAWPQEVKDRALDLYEQHGPTAAAEMTGVPTNTVKSWAFRAGLTDGESRDRWERETLARQGKLSAEEAEAHQAEFREWMTEAAVERERNQVDQEFSLAAEVLDQIRKLAEDERARDVKDRAIAIGVLIDKLRLIQGHATERTEVITLGSVEQEIRKLEAELGIHDQPSRTDA